MTQQNHYYNTTRLRGQLLLLAESSAEKQESAVLDFFKLNPHALLSAEDIGRLVLPKSPRTSWGRCLSNLKELQLIVKTDEQVIGEWGRPIYLWRLLQPGEALQLEIF